LIDIKAVDTTDAIGWRNIHSYDMGGIDEELLLISLGA
jgi:hypothetical protein